MWGILLAGALATGAAQADEPGICPTVTKINDYDTDDIIWLKAGPYTGVVAHGPRASHLRVLGADGAMVMHLFVTADAIVWPVLPSEDANARALVRMSEQAASCGDLSAAPAAVRAMLAGE
jgi:hypothetical protein